MMNLMIYGAGSKIEPNSGFTEFIKQFQWEPMRPPFDPEVDDAVRSIKMKCEEFLKSIADPELVNEVSVSLEKVIDEIDVTPDNFFTALLMVDEYPKVPSEILESVGEYKSGENLYKWDPKNKKIIWGTNDEEF